MRKNYLVLIFFRFQNLDAFFKTFGGKKAHEQLCCKTMRILLSLIGFLAHLKVRALLSPRKMWMTREKLLWEGNRLMAVQNFKEEIMILFKMVPTVMAWILATERENSPFWLSIPFPPCPPPSFFKLAIVTDYLIIPCVFFRKNKTHQ